jgi:alkylation response protein AidB-like acyl-CoA dehydrogenase
VTQKLFETTEEQQALRESTRRFLDKRFSLERVREIVEEGIPSDPHDWRVLSEQMGLTAVVVPERWGGAGSGWLEQVVIFEEMGRALYAGPYLSTVALATPALLLSNDPAAQERFLPRIAAGELTGTLAFVEPAGDWALTECETSAEEVDGQWLLHGTKCFVRDGVSAGLILVVARTDVGLSLFAVEGDSPTCRRARQETADKTLELAKIVFDGTPATLVGAAGLARTVVAATLDYGALALAADQVGGAQRCLDMSVAYAKTRHQFGRPIGSFQAIKHMCVDMLTDVEWARSTVHRAAWDASEESSEFAAHASLAKAQCSTTYASVAASTIQVHGGLGFTWEHDAHLFFKRAKSSELFLGDPAYHRELFLQRAVDQ